MPAGSRRTARSDPFVAEAKAALAEGIVADADLVDAGAIFGTGFAPFRGGPLHYAARQLPRTAALCASRELAPATHTGRGVRPRRLVYDFEAATGDLARVRAGRHQEASGARPGARYGRSDRGKDLAQALPEGRSRRDRRQRVRVGARRVRGERRQVRGAARVHVHGQVDHVRRARHAVGGVRRAGCRRRAARRARASR